ncbi:RidA family protein [Flavihumibacter solisilvae]|uniref:Endoribonuclease L-PSP n=1 Tax=Flavihumibacter solisilvae TaxID=1349421 RepID=A0A0C1L370_9BACT|nr:RidA family protein [Flavihumibacter solisilvae]KIC94046.1 endoribonuclease L-PSP [Flavihumibacter solisilvae]
MKLLMLVLALALTHISVAQTPEQNLDKLKIKLPPASAPVASYVNAVRTGNLVFLAGKGPKKENGEYITGRLGENLTIEQGYEAARLTAVNQVAVLKDLLGDLGKVRRIVKVNGFVNSTAEFYDQPKVINGYSDLLIQVFGDKGKHARTALSVNALPFNMAVEVEMVVEVE